MANPEDVSTEKPGVTTIKSSANVSGGGRPVPNQTQIVKALKEKNFDVADDDVSVADDGTVTIKNQKFQDAIKSGTFTPHDINLGPFCTGGNILCP
jgi:hypothetical protein